MYNTFEEFKEDLLAALGGTLVDVELEDRDYRFALRRAMSIFKQQGNNSYRKSFLPVSVDPAVLEYPLPIPEQDGSNKIDTIVKIVKQSGGWNIDDPFSVVAYNDMFSGVGTSSAGCAGCSTNFLQYELTMQQIETAKRYMVYETQFIHDKFRNTITLLKRPEMKTIWLLECYVDLTDLEYMQIDWIFRWTLAELKHILGMAYRKFGSLPSPTGETNLSGSEYIQEAKDDKALLQEEILNGVDGNDTYVEIRMG
ncbi:neck protein [Alishewanella phage vB_AspM_Slickus01]|nr:neck protein [Alishewanella phage vB_AspM_Slicko01]WGH49813.1 neck protein [Alishewanella phage vB_AspM_Slickus01]